VSWLEYFFEACEVLVRSKNLEQDARCNLSLMPRGLDKDVNDNLQFQDALIRESANP